jgi:hypothetical protein
LVRLRAAENAPWNKNATVLVAPLKHLAAKGAPAVRGAALASLGKIDADAAAPLIEVARKAASPLVRRGALWACENAGRGGDILTFLQDRSPVVLLAATRVTGRMLRRDCVERLGEVLLDAPDDILHAAARKSLDKIGPAICAVPAAELFRLQVKEFKRSIPPSHARSRYFGGTPNSVSEGDPQWTPRQKMLNRNITSLCYLLRRFKCPLEFDERMWLLKNLRIDSKILTELVPSISVIAGNRHAVPTLITNLTICRMQGMRELIEMTKLVPAPIEYSSDVTAETIAALIRLGATNALGEIKATMETNYQSGRLWWPVTVAGRDLPKFVTPDNRATIEKLVLMVLDDKMYRRRAIFEMCKTAGKLKIAAAAPHLKRILTEERYTPLTMLGAAWGLQELTGAKPPIPLPALNESGSWIVQQTP